MEALRLAVEELARALEQHLARTGGERADRLVAEQRFEDALAGRRRAARDGDLRARQAAGLREHGEHHDEPGAVDAE